ncbi:amino acid adenylation domain-containing protein [Tumebacillus sp. BK434]|uniref:non-ribosomal peptide synthetase n=1 Tax=Tumebacillus sp. BK434 TaxID=2512169 RepID=UPI001052413A|nr:non-ribosomal peptide synthetase [Tumebacillus sp. BK434]TCP59190.1 amino acid adenylation domain-containing protein [Tumebacillus sp. BK434]
MSERCIYQLFEEQAVRTPDRVAVVSGGESLTYRELNRLANRLAADLRSNGVASEQLVGICTDRSVWMMVGLLGIWKAGGAYVPLDPSYPAERLAHIMSMADVQVLVTQQALQDVLPAHQAERVWLDDLREELPTGISENWDENAGGSAHADALAYVIFTSGSTGKPKGVAVEHRSVYYLLEVFADVMKLGADDVQLSLASFAFDMSVLELYLPLTLGARLILGERGLAGDGAGLRRLLEEQQVTMLQATPVTWHLLLDAGWGGTPEMRVVTGGEALPAPLAQRLLATDAQIWNAYGPTECTVWATLQRVEAAERAHVIGKALPGTAVYVLDHELQPVSPGESGELFIGGGQVARGYHGAPDLTVERFLPDRFSAEEGARMYRTGDLVELLPDGSLAFVGRADDQVKIRGYRVELGEIERVLETSPLVRQAAAVLREEVPGEQRLVAYVVPERGTVCAAADLRAVAAERLPEYMVPSRYVLLDALPLTPNGKVDRKGLPAPEQGRPELSAGYVAPTTPLELAVVQVWEEVLGFAPVGMQDRFGELGVHSLQATQAAARIRERLGAELTVRDLFAAETVEDVARLAAERSGREVVHPLQPMPKGECGTAGVSFAQQRLWFLDRLQPNSAAYNIPVAIELLGRLEVQALQAGLTEIVRRHETLRTVFAEVDGEPLQVIVDPMPVVLQVEQLDREQADLETEREAGMPFDLAAGPLFRARLLRVTDEEHVLLLTMHHIISDGWSQGILYAELAAWYRFFTGATAERPAELGVQYADYAAWQRVRMAGERLDGQVAYWKEKLGGTLPLSQLPTDRPRPAQPSQRGKLKTFRLEQELLERLQALSRREGVTLYMTLLAAFQTLLHRYSGETDIIVGSPVAGRNHPAVERLVGFFVNTLVLRTDLQGNPPFTELLQRVRVTALEALAHGDVPFERLVEELQPERSPGISPLCQVVFALQNVPMAELELPGLNATVTELDSGTAKFDLTVMMTEQPDGLLAQVEYSTELFEEATIDRLMAHFRVLLHGIAQEPERAIGALPLLTDKEREQVLFGWNKTQVEFDEELLLHQLFEAQANRTPDAVAAVYGEQQLTYRELEEQANRLAHRLIELGTGPDVAVGVCLERSLELVVALIGILKAGGAYVPLDTDAPTARIEQILTDAKAPVCLIQSRLREKMPAAGVVYLELDLAETLHGCPDHPPVSAVTSEHLVSIYYTSGSTGKPKGVCSTHKGWVNRMLWMQRHYRLQAGETVLQKTTLTFDDAACEFYWPLLAGGRIALLEPGLHKDPRAILDAAIEYQAAFLTFVPSMLALFVDAVTEADRVQLKALRHVGSSGEALRSDLVRAFQEKLGCLLHNTWGATEVSIDSTVHTCTEEDARETEIVSVGRPLDNNRCYVLDGQLQPVPVGVPGDLYLAGIGLARGYLNDPEKTAAAFVADPFVPGERMYKTGDRGYFRRDGRIMFLGRLDDQIKVRGQRVEVGEIEAVLAAHPGLEQSSVKAFKGSDGYRLAAYCVPRAGQEDDVTPEALRAFMGERLPEYMVPWRFVKMEGALPTTVSGKIDRKALPDPGEERPDLHVGFAAPETELQRAIAELWQELLKVKEVGIYDNFFDLGGHSLTATRILSRINRKLEVHVPLKVLFEAPTVAGLAEYVQNLHGRGEQRTPVAIERLGGQGEHELSHAQKRFWFQYLMEPLNACGGVSAKRIDGPLDAQRFLRAYAALCERHSIMRATFAERDGLPVQVLQQTLEQPIVYTDTMELPEEERWKALAEAVRREQETPFHLREETAFRAGLYKMAEQEHLLVITLHPIAYDSWSEAVFMQDLSTLYQEKPMAPAVQYTDYAAWQNRLLGNRELEEQRAYWAKRLQEDVGAPALPYDFAAPPAAPETEFLRNWKLDAELTGKLRELAAAQGTTMYVLLLAGYKIWLSLVSRQEQVTVCAPLSGRSHPDLEGVLGVLVNPVAMRTDFSGNPSGLQAIERVKETAVGAYAHQDYPFDLVLQDLRANGLAAQALYKVVFVGQNAHLDEMVLEAGVTLTNRSMPELFAPWGLDVRDYVHNRFAGDPSVQLDLHVDVFEGEADVLVMTRFNPLRFAGETIEGFLAQYTRVLEQLAEDPSMRLSQFVVEEAAFVLDDLF